MKTVLVYSIEKPVMSGTPLAQAMEIVSFAVGTFNGGHNVSPYGERLDDWREYLKSIIKMNIDAFNNPKIEEELDSSANKFFGWAVQGSHFWLHDLYDKRVVLVTAIEVEE